MTIAFQTITRTAGTDHQVNLVIQTDFKKGHDIVWEVLPVFPGPLPVGITFLAGSKVLDGGVSAGWIKVPLAAQGSYIIVAKDAEILGDNEPITIDFVPLRGGIVVVSDASYVQTPGDMNVPANRVKLTAMVYNQTTGLGLEGIQLTYTLTPTRLGSIGKPGTKAYEADQVTEAALVMGKPSVLTDAGGLAELYITTGEPIDMAVSVEILGYQDRPSSQVFFGTIDQLPQDNSLNAPSVETDQFGVLEIQADKVDFKLSLRLPQTVASGQDKCFIVFNDDEAMLYPSDGSSTISVPYAYLNQSPDTDSNKIAYFLQNTADGNIVQSPTSGFGVIGTYQNRPIASERPRIDNLAAPHVVPDIGASGTITVDTLSEAGLTVHIDAFPTQYLGLATADPDSLSAEVRFYMNGYIYGSETPQKGKLYVVTKSKLPLTNLNRGVAAFEASLPYANAIGWARSTGGVALQFWCEYVIFNPSTRQRWISQYKAWAINTANPGLKSLEPKSLELKPAELKPA